MCVRSLNVTIKIRAFSHHRGILVLHYILLACTYYLFDFGKLGEVLHDVMQ